MDKLGRMPCLISNGDCCGRLEIHHLNDHGVVLGHLHTIRLCQGHHGPQTPLPLGEAYHKGKKLFIAKYGDNEELLERQKLAVMEMENASY